MISLFEMKISFRFSHVPDDCCVLKPVASLITCQWVCLMASVTRAVSL